MIDLKTFKEHLSYDPESGVFTRLAGKYHRAKKGDVAGARHIEGYLKFCLLGVSYLAHRAAFFYMTGEWPETDVDHINGDRSDNRWSNLRLASRSQNNCNSGRRRNNTSGHKGVRFHKKAGKWMAEARINGERIYLGLFDTAEAASEAYSDHAQKTHGEFLYKGARNDPYPLTTEA